MELTVKYGEWYPVYMLAVKEDWDTDKPVAATYEDWIDHRLTMNLFDENERRLKALFKDANGYLR